MTDLTNRDRNCKIMQTLADLREQNALINQMKASLAEDPTETIPTADGVDAVATALEAIYMQNKLSDEIRKMRAQRLHSRTNKQILELLSSFCITRLEDSTND